MFLVAELTQGRPLYTVALTIFEALGLLVSLDTRCAIHHCLPSALLPSSLQAPRSRASSVHWCRRSKVMQRHDTSNCFRVHASWCPQNWKLDRRKVEAFLAAAEQAYGRDNPYHNSTHAADVVQAAFIMLRSVQQPQFTKLEVGNA